jgi:hypothetical protein
MDTHHEEHSTPAPGWVETYPVLAVVLGLLLGLGNAYVWFIGGIGEALDNRFPQDWVWLGMPTVLALLYGAAVFGADPRRFSRKKWAVFAALAWVVGFWAPGVLFVLFMVVTGSTM